MRGYKLVDAIVDCSREEIDNRFIVELLDFVVAGICEEASIEVSAGEILDDLLLTVHSAGANLRVDVIRQRRQQTRLDRKRLVEEAAIEFLLYILNINDRNRRVVVLRAAGSTNHLKHIYNQQAAYQLEASKQASEASLTTMPVTGKSTYLCVLPS